MTLLPLLRFTTGASADSSGYQISWNTVSNATSNNINGSDVGNTQSAVVNVGNQVIYAVGNTTASAGGTIYRDSASTEKFLWKLAAPTNLYIDDATQTITWSPSLYASSYNLAVPAAVDYAGITITGIEAAEGNITTVISDLNKAKYAGQSFDFKLRAVGDGDWILNSDLSDAVSYTVPADVNTLDVPTNFKYDGANLTWMRLQTLRRLTMHTPLR